MGQTRKPAVRPEVRGTPTSGRIVRLVRGQGHGFLKTKEGREVFFHRADVPTGAFPTLEEGDVMTFELVEDKVSGPRAIKLRKADD
jgi:cold shock CspA family protein